MSKFWVVVEEVYRKNVKSLGFLVMVFGPLVLMLIIGIIGFFIGMESIGTKDASIAILSNQAQIVSHVTEQVDSPNIVVVNTLEEAQEQLNREKIEGYLVLEATDQLLKADFFHKTTNKTVNLSGIEDALSQYHLDDISKELNLTDTQVSRIKNAQVHVNKREVKVDDEGQILPHESEEELDQRELSRMIKIGTAYVIATLTFIFTLNFSGIIAQEIASEKGTRIMEIILSSVSPTTHFFGKIVGVLLVILTQIIIYFAMGSVSFNLPFVGQWIHQFMPNFSIPTDILPVVIPGVFFLLFGAILYVSIAAFLGSLVTRVEDIQKAMSPISLIGVVGFYVGLYAMANPNSLVVVVVSYIPLWTPFVMPFRMAAETVGNLQIAAGMGVLMLGTLLITWISIIFYRSNVLIYTDESMFQAFKRSLSILKSEKWKVGK